MWTLLIIILCIALNAALAGIEIAVVSVNKSLVRHHAKQGDRKAKRLLELKEKPERTLSTIQVGITLLATLTAAIGGTEAGLKMVPLIHETFQISLSLAEIVAIVVVVIPITYFTVVVGEITPKAIAIRNPYFFATLGTPILNLLRKFLYPIVKLCESSTKALLKAIPLKKMQESEQDKEYLEYETLLSSYYRLPKKGKEYMVNLAKIQEKTLEEILLDWNQVEFVTTDQNLDALIEKIISSGHTRMPVVENGHVVGLINTKEVLALSRSDEVDWKKLMRVPVKFKKDDSLLFPLNVLQNRRIHMGVVVNDSNQPVGIVTIEDIIEEVLGEIYDEDDRGSLQRILKTEPS